MRTLYFLIKKLNIIKSYALIAHTNVLARKISQESFTNHAMRHSFATTLKENDTQEDYIALIMGHQDISTTRHSYIDLDTDQEKIEEKI